MGALLTAIPVPRLLTPGGVGAHLRPVLCSRSLMAPHFQLLDSRTLDSPCPYVFFWLSFSGSVGHKQRCGAVLGVGEDTAGLGLDACAHPCVAQGRGVSADAAL